MQNVVFSFRHRGRQAGYLLTFLLICFGILMTYGLRRPSQQVRACEVQFAGTLRVKRCPSAGAEGRFAPISSIRCGTDYIISSDSGTVEEITFLLKRLSSIESCISIFVNLSEADNSCMSRTEELRYEQYSCRWWRLMMQSSGYAVELLPDDQRLRAVLLHKDMCGCACGALANTSVLQNGDGFSHEFGIAPESWIEEKLALLVDNAEQMETNMYNSCAVVYSSGLLSEISPGLGTLIDSHDLVFRFNQAPAGGNYTFAVGQKTTHRLTFVPETSEGVLASISSPAIESYDEALLLLSVHLLSVAPKVLQYSMQRKGGIGIISTEVRRQASYCAFNAFHEYPQKPKSARDGVTISQGLLGLFTALKICKRTVLFGKVLGVSPASIQSLPYYYYPFPGGPDPVGNYKLVHGADQEALLIEHLENNSVLSVVPGRMIP